MAKKKNSKKMSYIIGGIIIFIMISSAFGVILGGYAQSNGKVRYNDYVFKETNQGRLSVDVDGKEHVFDYTPDQLNYFEIDESIIEKVRDSPEILATYNYSSTSAKEISLAYYEMQNIHFTDKNFAIGSITRNSFNHPVINCDNATETVPVLYFKIGNQTKMQMKDGCIIAEGINGYDIIALKDKLVMSVIGII